MNEPAGMVSSPLHRFLHRFLHCFLHCFLHIPYPILFAKVIGSQGFVRSYRKLEADSLVNDVLSLHTSSLPKLFHCTSVDYQEVAVNGETITGNTFLCGGVKALVSRLKNLLFVRYL